MSPKAAAKSKLRDTVDDELPPLSTGRQFQPIAQLTLLPGNPRMITEEQFINLCASIKRDPRFLFVRPPAVADGPAHHAGRIIYGGNMRIRALEHLYRDGWEPGEDAKVYAAEKGYVGEWLPGYSPIDVDDIPKELAYERAVQDNNTWGQWEDQALAEMVYRMNERGTDLTVLGFDQRVMDDLLASVSGPEEDYGPEGSSPGGGGGAGNREVGPDTEERFQTYQNTSIRQVVLYYQKEEYDNILNLLEWTRLHFAAESNTEAVTKALRQFQNEHADDEPVEGGAEEGAEGELVESGA